MTSTKFCSAVSSETSVSWDSILSVGSVPYQPPASCRRVDTCLRWEV